MLSASLAGSSPMPSGMLWTTNGTDVTIRDSEFAVRDLLFVIRSSEFMIKIRESDHSLCDSALACGPNVVVRLHCGGED